MMEILIFRCRSCGGWSDVQKDNRCLVCFYKPLGSPTATPGPELRFVVPDSDWKPPQPAAGPPEGTD